MLHRARILPWILLLAGAAGDLRADYRDSFETAERTWQLADIDPGIRVTAHHRDFQTAHSGRASEAIQVHAAQGTFAYFVHRIPPARVIREWRPGLWVRSDRSGIQLLARVVLPRSRDPQGGPVTVLIRGDVYDRVGLWQQLTIGQPDLLLQRQVRVLRSKLGTEIDPREAYVDLLVVNAYGGAGTTNVWLDDLELFGHVPAAQFAGFERDAESAGQGGDTTAALSGTASVREPAVVRGSVLEAGGGPFFPRVIEHNGESLESLRGLGFNAVRLQSPPTGVQLREAARLGMWLVSPPPADGQITAAHDVVLAWDAGRRLGLSRLELTRKLAGDLQRSELRNGRALVGAPVEQIWNYSRLFHFVVFDREPLGSALGLQDYGRWLQQRPTLARPGTPFWAGIQTQHSRSLVGQWVAAGLPPAFSTRLEAQQLRLLAYQAIASGARGLVFRSRDRLDGQDADSRHRAASLSAVNRELELVEPWVAGGSRSSEHPATDPAHRISVLSTERSQLLIVMDQSPDQQFTVGGAQAAPMPLVVPSHATAPQVFSVEPGGLRPLQHKRVPGGIRILVEGQGSVRLIALTQDPLAIQHLAKTAAANKAELARLWHELGGQELEQVEAVHARLVSPRGEGSDEAVWLQQARENLRQCEALLGASDYQAAYRFAIAAHERLGRVRRNDWQLAARNFPSPVSSPFTVAYGTLPQHQELARRLQAAPEWTENVLPAADFENLDHLQGSGWRNFSVSDERIRAAVALASQRRRAGSSSLCLAATPVDPEEVPTAFESPPIRIVSPPLAVRRGQWIRVHGWLDIPDRLQGGGDGLLVYDSLGGRALAESVQETQGWREVLLYRVAPRDEEVTLTLELSGVGTVYLDDFEVCLHDPIQNP